MTRMQDLRDDARLARDARRGRASVSPAPLAAPFLFIVTFVPSATLIAAALGLSLFAVIGVAVAATLIAALIAHRTLSSLFAGLVLAVVRPYAAGERLRIFSPSHGCIVEATLVQIGAANTTLATDTGLLVLANNRLLKDVPERAQTEPCW
jgi:small-conductance mechanosensitive channel